MTYIVTLTNGTLSIDLTNRDTGWQVREDTPGVRLSSDQIFGSDRMTSETFNLLAVRDDPDGLALAIQNLLTICREIEIYRREPSGMTPFVLQVQLSESKMRYAEVYGVAQAAFSDLWTRTLKRGLLQNVPVTIIHGPWRDNAPGVLPDAFTLTKTDGPADADEVHVINFTDPNAISHVYNLDNSAGAWSANLYGTAHKLFQIGANLPAIDDKMYIGGTGARCIVLPTGPTIADFVATIALKYSAGGGVFTALTLGTDYLILPMSTISDIGKWERNWVLYIKPPSLWAVDTVNGVAGKYWIMLHITAVTSWAVSPELSSPIYAQTKPYIEIPASTFSGDAPPAIAFKLAQPYGGGLTPGFGTPSRVLVAARSRGWAGALGDFTPYIPLGGVGLSAGWETAYGADTAAAVDVTSPAWSIAACTFATVATSAVRVRIGSKSLDDFYGRFKVFLRAKQNGGAARDTYVQLKTFLNSYLPGNTNFPLEVKYLRSVGAWEVIDLTGDGYLQLPFVDTSPAEVLSMYVHFRIFAGRTAGVSTLSFSDLILFPIDEFCVELRDPVSDTTDGSSALRGDVLLDIDGGVVRDRTMKQKFSVTSPSTGAPLEAWLRSGDMGRLRPGTAYRVYVLPLTYPTSWGVEPLISPPTMGFAVSIRGSSHWNLLRGND